VSVHWVKWTSTFNKYSQVSCKRCGWPRKLVHLLPVVFFQFQLEERWGMEWMCNVDVIISQERLKIEVKLQCSAAICRVDWNNNRWPWVTLNGIKSASRISVVVSKLLVVSHIAYLKVCWSVLKEILQVQVVGMWLSDGLLTPSTPTVPNCCCSKGLAPYWSNPPFLISDVRALWRSILSARAPKRQKLKMVG